ncbi:MAG TPA: DUF349 domain-containing protein [Actinomycetes bacterium]|nr:DUF349 domain-containing protein [Actinomycetes bacterium]
MSEQPWGRVDDAGAVFVRTADGEHKVGEWLAGDRSEGLAYYQRRYASLTVDVDLLEHRLKDAGLAPDEAMAKIGKLRTQVDDPTCVGDLSALRARLDALVAAVDQQRSAREAERTASRERAKALREDLVTEAEGLADSTHWKASGERFRAIVEEWKHLPHVERSFEQQLWKRLSHARAAFEKRRRAWFAERDAKREEAAVVKEKLIKEAEGIAESTDWTATAAQFRGLMTRWKAAGQAPRGADDELWQRFKAAQDRFFAARSAAFTERDAGLADNLAAKLALATEAEKLLPVQDPAAARAALRKIQDKWAEIGHVPRSDRDAIEKRLQAVEQAVRDTEETRWRRSNPEARARATATLEQLTKSIGKLEKQLSAAQEKGDTSGAKKTQEAIDARREWMAQAEQSLAEFSP